MEDFSPEAPNDKVYKYTCRANDYFERQLYAEAVQDYSRAITAIAESDDTHFAALLHSNRSASYYKLKNWDHADRDARETIRLEPTWAKVNKGLHAHKQAGRLPARFQCNNMHILYMIGLL